MIISSSQLHLIYYQATAVLTLLIKEIPINTNTDNTPQII